MYVYVYVCIYIYIYYYYYYYYFYYYYCLLLKLHFHQHSKFLLQSSQLKVWIDFRTTLNLTFCVKELASSVFWVVLIEHALLHVK